jgi:chemotaxis protein CheD
MSRYWEPRIKAYVQHVMPGELHVTNEDIVIATVLGSCVSACVRDVRRAIGGINHFMLPQAVNGDTGDLARYGVSALELLLNQVVGTTGGRRDLEVKVFGGGRVIEGGGDIGRLNIELVRRFFAAERIAIQSEDLGDHYARRIRYWPRSGRVQVQRIPMSRARDVVASERKARKSMPIPIGSVELF